MREWELKVKAGRARLPATLTAPDDAPVGGIVPLHGANVASRDSFLLAHLARVLPPCGWAVMRYDRRPSKSMVPFAKQAADALAALRSLRSFFEPGGFPIGMWGFSQGAWSATTAAARSADVAFLVLVGFSGVSPGRQMRYFTSHALRNAGFDDETSLAELSNLRETFERFARGELRRPDAQAVVDEMKSRPWFELAFVPPELPPRVLLRRVIDLDFDPRIPLQKVRCPVLALYGDDEQGVPIDESIRAIESTAADVTVVRYAGVGHNLTDGPSGEAGTLTPDYERDLVGWISAACSVRRRPAER